MATNIKESLAELSQTDGFIASALVDSASGMTLGANGGSENFDIEVAAAMNTEVVKAKIKAAEKLKLDGAIEDILITLTDQYHLIRPVSDRQSVFFYLALDRKSSNLAMARMKLRDAEQGLQL